MFAENQYIKSKEIYQVDLDIVKQIIKKCNDLALYKKVYTDSKAHNRMTGGYYNQLIPEKPCFSTLGALGVWGRSPSMQIY